MPEMGFETLDFPIKEFTNGGSTRSTKEVMKFENGTKAEKMLEKPVVGKTIFPFPVADHHLKLKTEAQRFSEVTPDTFREQFYNVFKSINLKTELLTSGTVWNENEEAEYRVTLTNDTYFDFKGLFVRLRLLPNPDGEAIFVGPTRLIYGDMPYRKSLSKTFTLKATKVGNIDLWLTVYGNVDPIRCFYSYNGWHLTPWGIWVQNKIYRATYPIVAD